MGKHRIYEIAKELGKSNQEVDKHPDKYASQDLCIIPEIGLLTPPPWMSHRPWGLSDPH